LNIENHVQFLGSVDQGEIVNLYHKSHLFVLASVTASSGDREGQALVLQEAQAVGLPVISTKHNGIPDGVLDGRSGYLVPEKNVEALAQKINYLLDHPECWVEMGRRGREFVENKYDTKILGQTLVDLYQQAIQRQ